MGFIFWLIAVIMVVYGLIRLINGDLLLGLVLVILGLAIGPGGWSIFNSH